MVRALARRLARSSPVSRCAVVAMKPYAHQRSGWAAASSISTSPPMLRPTPAAQRGQLGRPHAAVEGMAVDEHDDGAIASVVVREVDGRHGPDGNVRQLP